MVSELETALSTFYDNNGIDHEQYTDNRKEHYLTGVEYDPKICKSNLEEVLNEWLHNFEEKDRAYYLKMFENFTYLTRKSFEWKVYCLKEYIFDILSQYPKDKIMIILSESKSGYKSGASEMASALWSACDGEIRKSQIREMYSKAEIEELINMDAIIFADDIVATGFSLKETIEKFFERFPYKEFTHTKFYATGVLATKRGKRVIDKLCKSGIAVQWVYNENYLVQAFKGDYIFAGSQKAQIEETILKYEEKIGKDDDGKSYVMGFEACKLLVAFHYETPNNTLCTFWRYGEQHVPLFERNSNQKLSLREIIDRKKTMSNNAYMIKSLEKKDGSI